MSNDPLKTRERYMNTPTIDKEAIKTEKQNRLWIVCYADALFNEALRVVQFCLNEQLDHEHPLYQSALLSIAVRYAAPFTEVRGKGMMRLTPEFFAFEEDAMRRIHGQLVNARHKYYAHIDPAHMTPLSLEITRTIHGADSATFGYRARVGTRFILPTDLPDIKRLCELQLERTAREILLLMPAIVSFEKANAQIGVSGGDNITIPIPYTRPPKK